VVVNVLATLGQLARVSAAAFKPHVAEVLPLVIEAITGGHHAPLCSHIAELALPIKLLAPGSQPAPCSLPCSLLLADVSAPAKRIVAVRTLGQIAASSGAVMMPYMEFPQVRAGHCPHTLPPWRLPAAAGHTPCLIRCTPADWCCSCL